MYLKIITSVLTTIILITVHLKIFSQEVIKKEYAVIDKKNLIIYEKADLSSDRISYNELNPAFSDTLGIINRAGEFLQIKYFSGENLYKNGWILNSVVKKKMLFKSALNFNIDISGISKSEKIKNIIAHTEWNEIIKSTVYNGEILKGMDNKIVLASIGKPNLKNKYFSSSSIIEQWTYSRPPDINFVLNFEDGVFTSFKRYEESINLKIKRELSKRKEYPYRKKGVELMGLGAVSFGLAFAFLRDENNDSVLFSQEHKTVSWIILSTFLVAETAGIYLFQYTKESDEIGLKANNRKIELAYKHYF